jgi:hypothetical protein
MLQVESLTHLRRIGELQHDIDTLKKASAPARRERVRSVRPDGHATE